MSEKLYTEPFLSNKEKVLVRKTKNKEEYTWYIWTEQRWKCYFEIIKKGRRYISNAVGNKKSEAFHKAKYLAYRQMEAETFRIQTIEVKTL